MTFSCYLFNKVLKNKSSAVSNGCVSAVLRAMVNYGSSLNIVLFGVKTICNVIEIGKVTVFFFISVAILLHTKKTHKT